MSSPMVARSFPARTSDGYHDKDAIVADICDAGFGNVAIGTVTRWSVAPSYRFRQGTPMRKGIGARRAGRARHDDRRDRGQDRCTLRGGAGGRDGSRRSSLRRVDTHSASEHLVPTTFAIMPVASLRRRASDGPFA